MMAEASLDHADPLDPSDVQAATQAHQSSREAIISSQQRELRARRDAYSRLFHGRAMAGDSDIVLTDLKRFCRGAGTPWDADQRVHALLTGRFEVYTRIKQHLDMPFDELWEMLSGGIP